LTSVSREFGPVDVLRNITLDIEHGEFVALVGPSGCGKTTLLNILSGDDSPSSGVIQHAGRMRMVYQQDGLCHLTDPRERRRQVDLMIRLIQVEGFEDHYPHQLSGGMRQRVELARALAGDSDILLLDEPFSSLDYLTRLRMRQELARLLDDRPRTVVLVTHDIEEAAQLADRVIVLTDRPAQIRRELNITTPRPRDLTHPEVVHAVRVILTILGIEHEAAAVNGAR
jgi:NitT/TauT family transport system ATP-binding protein